MRLKINQNTTFKQSVRDSAALPEQDKVEIPAGKVFKIHSWKVTGNNHMRVAILGEFLGDPPRNTWYVYIPHVHLINDRGKVVPITPARPQRTIPRALPPKKLLNVPHKSQLDNALNPTGACNVTSFAMVMQYFRVKRQTNAVQFEDELYRYMVNYGLSRWEPGDLARMAREYGLRDDFTMRGRLYDIRKAIAEGRPCIIHGYFTSFGHIIVVRGYDQRGFFVNDPYGEWFPSGYRNDLSGANLHYSNELIKSKCSPEGEDYIWLHRLSLR